MLRGIFTVFLGLITIIGSAQTQIYDYKALKIRKLDMNSYPELKLNIDYYDFSDTTSLKKILLFENGLKADINEVTSGINKGSADIYFVPFMCDSNKVAGFIKKLSKWKQDRITTKLIMYKDSANEILEPDKWLERPAGWKGIFDTVSLDLVAENLVNKKPVKEANDDILIFLSSELNSKILSLISDKFKKAASCNSLFIAVLFQKTKKSESIALGNLSDSLKISLIQYNPDKENPEILVPFIKPVLTSLTSIRWKSCESFDLNSHRSISVTVNDISNKAEFDLPDTLLSNIYVKRVTSDLDTLVVHKKWEDCINLLNKSYKILASGIFRSKAEQILDSIAVRILSDKNPKPFSDFLTIEAGCKVPLTENYQKLKIKRAEDFYDFVDRNDIEHSERLKISEYLLSMLPESKENIFRYRWAKARLAESSGDKWTSLSEYNSAYAIIKSEKVNTKIANLVKINLQNSAQQNDWKRIKQGGSEFFGQIKDSFPLRYLYARSCFELSDFNEAITQFEWLLFNWEDNTELKWNSALNYLQLAYIYSSRFDDALKICKRNYRERKDPESLDMALLNIRLSWLKPVMNAFSLWLGIIPQNENAKLSLSLSRVTMPSYIGSVRLTDMNGQTSELIYKNKSITDHPEKAPSAIPGSISVGIDGTNQWFVSQLINKKSISLFLINGKTDNQEQYFLSAIEKEPSNNQLWNQLSEYEQKVGTKLLAQFFSEIIGSSMQLNGEDMSGRYGEILDGNRSIQYIVCQKQDGKISFSKGFDMKNASYKEDDWKKSSKTSALYLIEMKYNNIAVYELTNPVFNGNSWEGVLRIGVKSN
jgi:hypothetical protein